MSSQPASKTFRDPRVRRVADFFETLSPDSVKRIDDIYAVDAFFKDPFNEVRGLAPIAHIFRHMFRQVDQPSFVVAEAAAEGDQAFLTWNFRFRMKRLSKDEHCIRGATHLRFDGSGKIECHRDYWDAAEELYEKLPLLGGLMRVLKRAARK